MRLPHYSALVALAATAFALPVGTTAAPRFATTHARPAAAPVLQHVYNLDYSNETITTFAVNGDQATQQNRFRIVKPKNGSTNGIATLGGYIYTAVDAPSGRPCTACFLVLKPDGTIVAKVPAPVISGAPGGADISDLAVDAAGDVFLSDFGQQATYWYGATSSGFMGPFVISQGTHDAASVGVTPDRKTVFVSGGCGFASVRSFTLQGSGKYAPGACFGIGTIALIGGSVDADGDVATPVDGAIGLVSISNPDGNGSAFRIPDPLGSVGSVAFSKDASVLYVADHKRERVYAFARPAAGWAANRKPRLLATYKGFNALNIIAVDA